MQKQLKIKSTNFGGGKLTSWIQPFRKKEDHVNFLLISHKFPNIYILLVLHLYLIYMYITFLSEPGSEERGASFQTFLPKHIIPLYHWVTGKYNLFASILKKIIFFLMFCQLKGGGHIFAPLPTSHRGHPYPRFINP